MAYDPEARETGSSAMVIAIVVLVLVVGAAIAYFATRGGDVDDVDVVSGPSTTIVKETEKAVPVPVPGGSTGGSTSGATTKGESSTTTSSTTTESTTTTDGGTSKSGTDSP